MISSRTSNAWISQYPLRNPYYVMPLLYPKKVCVHAQSTYTCTIRWVHVPQWCCLATVWRSVFLLWAPDNDFGQNVLFHSKSSPVYIRRVPALICVGRKQLFNPVSPACNKKANERRQRLCMYFSFRSFNSSISSLRTKLPQFPVMQHFWDSGCFCCHEQYHSFHWY